MVQGCRGQVRTLTTWYIFNMVIKPIIVQSPFDVCLRIPGIEGMLSVMRARGDRRGPRSFWSYCTVSEKQKTTIRFPGSVPRPTDIPDFAPVPTEFPKLV